MWQDLSRDAIVSDLPWRSRSQEEVRRSKNVIFEQKSFCRRNLKSYKHPTLVLSSWGWCLTDHLKLDDLAQRSRSQEGPKVLKFGMFWTKLNLSPVISLVGTSNLVSKKYRSKPFGQVNFNDLDDLERSRSLSYFLWKCEILAVYSPLSFLRLEILT